MITLYLLMIRTTYDYTDAKLIFLSLFFLVVPFIQFGLLSGHTKRHLNMVLTFNVFASGTLKIKICALELGSLMPLLYVYLKEKLECMVVKAYGIQNNVKKESHWKNPWTTTKEDKF